MALTTSRGTVKSRGVQHASNDVSGAGQVGLVAQLVEQGIENPRVGGSIPSQATTFPLVVLLTALSFAAGCGDKCEQLCVQTANRIADCKPDSLTWADLGARRKEDFANACRTDWDRVSGNLTTSDLREALDVCEETQREITPERMSCDQINALYLPIE